VHRIAAVLLAVFITLPARAAPPAGAGDIFMRAQAASARNPAVGAPLPAGDVLVLSAPPRETAEESERLYRPLAGYLAQVLGRPVEYRRPGDWGVYRTQMLRGAYDILFDDPHLNSYRIEKLGHQLAAKLPGRFQYTVIARTDYVFRGVQRMQGRTFCTYAPPHLGTLFLLSFFDNPARQPSLVAVNSWNEAFQNVQSGRCVAGVLPLAVLRELDPGGQATKVLFNSAELPNQAVSIGPRLSAAEKAAIAGAMLSPQADAPTAALRTRWGTQERFVSAGHEEYADLSAFLRNEWGFY
jgi:ABC-type phosphate/phosphonate transport system substrate-binding protein